MHNCQLIRQDSSFLCFDTVDCVTKGHSACKNCAPITGRFSLEQVQKENQGASGQVPTIQIYLEMSVTTLCACDNVIHRKCHENQLGDIKITLSGDKMLRVAKYRFKQATQTTNKSVNRQILLEHVISSVRGEYKRPNRVVAQSKRTVTDKNNPLIEIRHFRHSSIITITSDQSNLS